MYCQQGENAIDTQLATPEQVAVQQLKPLQLQAIALLVQGLNAKRTAEKLGIDHTTITLWRKNEAFMEEYRRQCLDSYESLLNHANARARALVDSENDMVAVKAVGAVYGLEAARMRANPNINVTHTVIDKLARAVAAQPDAVDAEFTELDNGLSALPDPMSQR